LTPNQTYVLMEGRAGRRPGKRWKGWKPMGAMVARERIALTAPHPETGEQVAVPEGHPAARSLLVGEGCEIELAVAKRFGIVRGRLPEDWEGRLEAFLTPASADAAATEVEAAPAAVSRPRARSRSARRKVTS
jgi:hypothetical protein